MLAPWKKRYDQPRKHIKKQRHSFANKGPSSQGYGFSSSHVWMWELDHREDCLPKNWCFWIMVLEKTLESPLACREIQPVHPKGDQSWVFIGGADVEAETPILWQPCDARWGESCSVVSDSLRPHGLYSPWNYLGQNTGVGSLFLFQEIFPTQGSNPGLPHCRKIL